MKKHISILLALFAAGCGGGSQGSRTGGSSSQPEAAVTSITITPTSANTTAGGSEQFSATVAGTGNFSQVVNWSVAGDGTINNAGLFTAGSSAGTATVQVASAEDPTVINSASVNVSDTVADLGNWSGVMTTSDGTETVPLDFHLFAQGNTLSSGNSLASVNLGVLGIWTSEARSQPSCTNLTLQQTPTFASVSGEMDPPSANPNTVSMSLSGTLVGAGQNPGSVSLTWTASGGSPIPPGTAEKISLTGQFSADGSTLSGTYTNSGYLAACFPSTTAGTFSFTKYTNPNTNTYAGTFAFGTAGQVPVSLNMSEYPILNIGALPGVCGTATSVELLDYFHGAGRFFTFVSDNFTQSSLAIWGISNDSAGNTITIYTTLTDGLFSVNSPCIQEVASTGNNLLNGITLTKQ